MALHERQKFETKKSVKRRKCGRYPVAFLKRFHISLLGLSDIFKLYHILSFFISFFFLGIITCLYKKSLIDKGR